MTRFFGGWAASTRSSTTSSGSTRIREAVPEIAISTDVIVGFCGETEAQFESTLRLLERVRYDQVFAAAYSERPGTPATHLAGRRARRRQAPAAEHAARAPGADRPRSQPGVGRPDGRGPRRHDRAAANARARGRRSDRRAGNRPGRRKGSDLVRLSGRTRQNKLVHLTGPAPGSARSPTFASSTQARTPSAGGRLQRPRSRRSRAMHQADLHDLIRVHGARENNLKDVSVEIPKRRLTVFTGVSGSGKSSLVFDTIAAESQRMINETYSAFVQGFMPSLARPDVDVLEGLTTAIIVDQERMGANVRSTVGTATDANAMLRILFSRLGQPHIGSSQAFSFNIASAHGSGAVVVERGNRKATSATLLDHRRDVPALRGHRHRLGRRPRPSSSTTPSRSPRARSPSPATRSTAGGPCGIYTASGFLDPNKPIREYTKKELPRLPLPRADQGEGQRRQPHLRGADPQDPEVDAVEGH